MTRNSDIAASIERNLVELCKKAARISNGRVVETKNYAYAVNNYVDWYNRVFDFDHVRGNPRTLMHQLREDIRPGGAPENLLLNVLSQSCFTEGMLRENDFTMFYEQTGMAMDLQIREHDDQDDGRDCRPIETAQELKEWVAVTEEAFGKERSPTLYQLFREEPDIRFFGCLDNERVVSTSMLFTHNGIAGIHLVGTLNQFRGKGFGTRVTSKALRYARDSGCEIAVLQSSAMGKGVYSRIGFSEYSKIFHWKLKKP